MTKPLTKAQRADYERLEHTSPERLLIDRLLAGSSKFTLVSRKTGARYTYWIRSGADNRGKNWSPLNQNRNFFFIKVLTGPDNNQDCEWLASLKRHDPDSVWLEFIPRYEQRTQPSRFAIEWFLHKVLRVGIIPSEVEILWAGSCCRCGRTLTVPESIKSGFGPECVGHA